MDSPDIQCKTLDRSSLYPWQEESLKKLNLDTAQDRDLRTIIFTYGIKPQAGKTGYMIADALDRDNIPLIIHKAGPSGPTFLQGKYEILYRYYSKLPVVAYLANNPAFRDPKATLPRGAQRKIDKLIRHFKNKQKHGDL